jgi:AcrR family transcriptional regulator
VSTSTETTLKGKTSRTTGRGLARAQVILQAAHELFVRDGYAAFSVRSVALQVGASLSNVQHYYPTKDALVEAMLLHAYGQYQQRIDRLLEAMPQASRLEQFVAAMDMLLADMKRPDVVGGITQTWVMAQQHPAAAATVARIQARERRTVYALIQGLAPGRSDDEVQARAALIVAQIEGLALQFAGKGRRRFTLAQLDAVARRNFLRLAIEP